MNKVNCSYSTLDDMYETFDKMDLKAGIYVPSVNDMKIITSNLAEYFPFLLWIEETGIETPENAEMRRVIKNIIRTRLNLTEEDAS